jgi:RimJ/RimL family protein N-acetyltransferase
MPDEPSRVVFLKGHKVILRPVEETDLPVMQRWINDSDVSRGLLAYLPMSMAAEREWLETTRKNTTGMILAVETLAGRHIGSIGLHGISGRDGTAFTGTLIGEKDCWGQGYATDAKMQLLHFAFHTVNLRKIYSSALEFNIASWRYNLKCGYKEEGRRVAQFYRDGRYWDEILLACFREEWEPLWEQYSRDL